MRAYLFFVKWSKATSYHTAPPSGILCVQSIPTAALTATALAMWPGFGTPPAASSSFFIEVVSLPTQHFSSGRDGGKRERMRSLCVQDMCSMVLVEASRHPDALTQGR